MSENSGAETAGLLTPEKALATLQTILQDVLNLESAAALGPEARLQEDLNVDSLAMVDLVIALEDGFGLKLSADTEVIKEVKSVGDLAELISKVAAEQHA